MCNRLGKKHRQYVGTDGLTKMKHQRMLRAPHRALIDSYRVRILNDHTSLRDIYWNPQHVSEEGVSKRLTKRKAKHYAKLEKYYDRT